MLKGAMYLDIIAQFSDYCCFTYACIPVLTWPVKFDLDCPNQVKGLSKVDDILLKWLAEYTRLKPRQMKGKWKVPTSFVHC